jgi:hypothetical protein
MAITNELATELTLAESHAHAIRIVKQALERETVSVQARFIREYWRGAGAIYVGTDKSDQRIFVTYLPGLESWVSMYPADLTEVGSFLNDEQFSKRMQQGLTFVKGIELPHTEERHEEEEGAE